MLSDAPNGDSDGQSTPLTDIEFYAYAKNIRSIRLDSIEQMKQLLAELENVCWDVILISESRTPPGTYLLDGGHILYTVLADGDFLGTGILLNAKHAKSTNVVHSISSPVLGLDFRINGIRIRAICGYDVQDFNKHLTIFDI